MVGSTNVLGQEAINKSELLELNRILNQAQIWPKTMAVFKQARLETNGLFLDRISPNRISPKLVEQTPHLVSLAATGFGLAVDVLMGQKQQFGLSDESNRSTVQKRLFQTLETVEKLSKEEYGYFLPHFVNGKTLENTAEISTIDTMIFYLGALACAQYCGPKAVEKVTQMMNRLDFETMRTRGHQAGFQHANHFSHGLSIEPETGKTSYIPYHWGGPYSEGVLLLNLMSLGSPQNVPESVYTEGWDQQPKPQTSPPPLFTYFYPFCFLPLQNKVDGQGNHFLEKAQQAIAYQKQFCQTQRYPHHLFGLTACDAPPPIGYKAYAPSITENDGTISPPAVLASMALAPQTSLEAIQQLDNMGGFQSPYGVVNALNVFTGWKSDDALLIDMGSMLLLLDCFEKQQNKDRPNTLSQISIPELLEKTPWVQKAFQRARYKNN